MSKNNELKSIMASHICRINEALSKEYQPATIGETLSDLHWETIELLTQKPEILELAQTKKIKVKT